MYKSIDISTSALVAQRTRLNTIASNIANVSTTRDVNGDPNPYVRKRVVFQVGMPGDRGEGVHVAKVEEDSPDNPGSEQFRFKYEPGHVDADARGYVRYPNVDLTRELVNALETARAYEANIQAIEVSKALNNQVNTLLQ